MKLLKLLGLERNQKNSIDMFFHMLKMTESDNLCFFYINLSNDCIHFTENIFNFIEISMPFFHHYTELCTFVLDEDVPVLEANLKSLINNQNNKTEFEFRFKQQGKVPIWMRCTAKHIVNSSENVDIIWGTLYSISNEINNSMIIESCLDGNFSYDAKTDTIVLVGSLFNHLAVTSGYYENANKLLNRLVYISDINFVRSLLRDAFNNVLPMLHTEFRMPGENGSPSWVSCRCKLFYDQYGQLVKIVGGLINIDELKVYNQYIFDEFRISKVTGLPNRYQLYEDMKEIFSSPGRKGYIFMLDVDDFSKLNQTYGYATGNAFLLNLGRQLQKVMYEWGLLYHFEADTFVILIDDINTDSANEQMSLFFNISDRPFIFGEHRYQFTLSAVGIEYPGSSKNTEDLLRQCEIAIKKNRLKSKNKMTIVTQDMNKKMRDRIELESLLRKSTFNDMEGFYLVYQPFVRASDSKIIGAEALLRWKHLDGCVFSPGIFIPIMEQLKLMNHAGNWILQQSAKQCREWLNVGFDQNFYISVNVAAEQLEANNFSDMVLRTITEYNLANNFAIELTERSAIIDLEQGYQQLLALSKNGVRLAIDDFGTGYSSLSYLKNIPADEIKIDRSFTQNIEADRFSQVFVDSIVRIAQSIHKTICIEGVETAEQANLLRKLKANTFQGYLFSEPLIPENLTQLVLPNRR